MGDKHDADCTQEQAARAAPLVTLHARVTPRDADANPYLALPFEVPPGVRRLEISYRHPGQGTGEAVLDLGLSDPRGSDPPRFPGLRGWSGSFRTGATVGVGAATPGYVPGAMTPGVWHVLLGLVRLPPGATEVEVSIRLSDQEDPPSPAAAPEVGPRPRRRRAGWRWLPGELHSHTQHSDAPGSLPRLVAEARAARLSFIAVTDHNTTSHLAHLDRSPDDLLLVPGVEVTTPRGHMNVWGVTEPLDFRCTCDDQVHALIRYAQRRGWPCSMNHPADWRFDQEAPVNAVEVWHGPSGPLNAATLARWEGMLARGRRVVAVGGGDYHCGKPGRLAHPTTWVRAAGLTVSAVLDAIRAGRVVLAEPEGPWLGLEVEQQGRIYGPGDEVPAGRVRVRCRRRRADRLQLRLATALGEVEEGELDIGDHRYVFAQLLRPGDAAFSLAALANPVWVAPEHRE